MHVPQAAAADVRTRLRGMTLTCAALLSLAMPVTVPAAQVQGNDGAADAGAAAGMAAPAVGGTVAGAAGGAAAEAAAAAPDTDAAALGLADQTAAGAQAVRDWRWFLEGAAGAVDGRRDTPSGRTGRLSMEVALDRRLAPDWRLIFEDRLDMAWTPGQRNTINTWKDGYLSWQPRADRLVDIGRVKTRFGAATGYNPTDFFRPQAVRSIVSADPNSLRNNRLGTGMLRGQALWDSGSLTAIVAPRLDSRPSDAPFAADFGATNDRTRWLLVASQRLPGGLDPQWLLFGGPGQSPQAGLNLSGLVNDATVAFVEWSGGRSRSQLVSALSGADDSRWRDRLAGGLTFTSQRKVTVTVEYEYDGAAPGRSDWQALFRSPAAYGRYRAWVQSQQEQTTRQALFTYVSAQDVGLQHLDLNGFVRVDLVDHSRMLWTELRYHFEHAELALQWQISGGTAGSNFGKRRSGAPRRCCCAISCSTRRRPPGPGAWRERPGRECGCAMAAPLVAPVRSGRWRLGERRPLRQPVHVRSQVGVACAPIVLRESELEPQQCTADADVGQRILAVAGPGTLAQARRHRVDRRGNLPFLTGDPAGRALLGRPLRDLGTQQDAGVEQPVAQGLPAFDFSPLATAVRDQLVHRRDRVQVLDDHAGIEHRAAIVHHQARDLAQWIDLRDRRVCRPGVGQLELALDHFFGEHHADLAGVGAGQGTDQLHVEPPA